MTTHMRCTAAAIEQAATLIDAMARGTYRPPLPEMPGALVGRVLAEWLAELNFGEGGFHGRT
ncbi:hypothetical protein [Aromatoleum anaerobium]|uniref:Uncharacterized protein n=1 Tax=Aromatoleum anaerobium TaxID=182180 RepID=A0ABX1PPA8_9RHOO|nr:hypothetical protein [Aromatoleum anaerobium]MCK0506339.1 DUF1320 domain-containing protein [Aromatoleum anaerobium]